MIMNLLRYAMRGVCACGAIAALGLAAVLAACAPMRLDVPRTESHAWGQPQQTDLGRAYAAQLEGHAGQSGFYLLSSGVDALGARAGLADAASRTIDLQYYLVQHDATSQLLLHRVMRAALRGVRVRLLVDDLFAAGKDFDLAAFAAHPNVEVRVFNPFSQRGPLGLPQLLEFFGNSVRLNRRMHNKLWIADNAAAIVGGRNLGDEYFEARGSANFCDLDVLAVGPVVAEVSRSFDDYWNSPWAVPIGAFAPPPVPQQFDEFEQTLIQRLGRFQDTVYARMLREGGLAAQVARADLPLHLAKATALYDLPGKTVEHAEGAFGAHMGPLLRGAQRSVLIVSPYFIPDAHAVALFAALTARGVRVRVFTNSLASTDVPAVHSAYARLRPALLDAGVDLYEMRPEAAHPRPGSQPARPSGSSLHAKAMVIDGRHVLVGSMNMDSRSRLYNTEVGVVLESEPLAADVLAVFNEGIRPNNAFRLELTGTETAASRLRWVSEQDGRRIVHDREPLAGWWRRLYALLAGLLAPEGLF